MTDNLSRWERLARKYETYIRVRGKSVLPEIVEIVSRNRTDGGVVYFCKRILPLLSLDQAVLLVWILKDNPAVVSVADDFVNRYGLFPFFLKDVDSALLEVSAIEPFWTVFVSNSIIRYRILKRTLKRRKDFTVLLLYPDDPLTLKLALYFSKRYPEKLLPILLGLVKQVDSKFWKREIGQAIRRILTRKRLLRS